ncbi:MAG: hypothetical protein QXL96_10645 [Ignisphaera sp.]
MASIYSIGKKLLRNLDLITLLTIHLIVFGELLVPGYIVNWDFTTIPNFVNVDLESIIHLLAGVNQGLAIPFSLHYSPGLVLLNALFLLIFKNYAFNIFFFLYIFSYTLGVYWMLKRFTEKKWVLVLGSLLATYNPAIMDVFQDSPGTLYLVFLPWFISFYYKYRIMSNDKKDLFISAIPLAFSSVYGPGIPAILASIVSVEIYAFYANKSQGLRTRVKKLILSVSFILLMFTLFHINLLIGLHQQLEILDLSKGIGSKVVPSFGLMDILLYKVAYPWQKIFNVISYSLFGSRYTSIYEFLLLVYALISISVLIVRKSLFPLIFGLITFGLLSYKANYLGLYTLFTHTFPVFNAINPYEYDALVSMFYSMSFPYVVNWLGHLRAFKAFSTLLLTALIVLGAIPMALNFHFVWSQTTVLQSFVEAYESVRGDNLVLIVPSTYAIGFNYYAIFNKTFFGKSYPQPNTPVTFFTAFPAYYLVDVPPNPAIRPYYTLVASLYSLNPSTFKYYADLIGLKYIIWFNSSTYSGAWWSFDLDIRSLIRFTNFSVYKNFSGSIVILENPNVRSLNIKMGELGFYVNLSNGGDLVVTPLPYSGNYIILPSNVNAKNYSGLLALEGGGMRNVGNTEVFITSWYVVFNLLVIGIIVSYILFILIKYYAKFKLVTSKP